MTSFVSDISLMCRLAQEDNRIRDFLGVTSPHEGEVVTHQGRSGVDILRTVSIIIVRLFRLPLHGGEHGLRGCGGGILCQMRNSRGAPTIPNMRRGIRHRDLGTRDYCELRFLKRGNGLGNQVDYIWVRSCCA